MLFVLNVFVIADTISYYLYLFFGCKDTATCRYMPIASNYTLNSYLIDGLI
ncbi:hypothetical protein M125_1672 [Bacteroides fragilis str. 3998T(B)3]|uniref:Uncharacterized protein n=1 Tax=Bacteroides fragilis str. 3998T(B)3 TaxID=1339316 RepID=A0A015V8F8_BACFG|nr:hypothetical protein M125_1672 [Bacteroides fragilis str. 3998T(B)3]EXY96515.1 hypothetical protein M081_1310 [Bacteroides fragilis str. 3998 T(B) 4]